MANHFDSLGLRFDVFEFLREITACLEANRFIHWETDYDYPQARRRYYRAHFSEALKHRIEEINIQIGNGNRDLSVRLSIKYPATIALLDQVRPISYLLQEDWLGLGITTIGRCIFIPASG